MNIEFCSKCLNGVVDTTIYFDKIQNTIIVFLESYKDESYKDDLYKTCSFTNFDAKESRELYNGLIKEIVPWVSKSILIFRIEKEKMYKVQEMIRVLNSFNSRDCPYWLEHQLTDWNRNT